MSFSCLFSTSSQFGKILRSQIFNCKNLQHCKNLKTPAPDTKNIGQSNTLSNKSRSKTTLTTLCYNVWNRGLHTDLTHKCVKASKMKVGVAVCGPQALCSVVVDVVCCLIFGAPSLCWFAAPSIASSYIKIFFDSIFEISIQSMKSSVHQSHH